MTWGTPKLIHQERDDTLALKYWSDLDKLETRTLLEQDRVVCEAADGQSAIHKLDVQASDMMITFTINLSAAQSAGLFWRNGETNRKGLGTIESAAGLILDGSSDTVSIVNVDRPTSFFATTILCHPKDDYHQQKIAGSPQHVRILVRSHMAEVYINEKWLFCIDISDAPESGSIGMIAGSGEAVITDLRIAEIKPLEPPMVEK
ncbi:MAG: hypothetical protein H8D34_34215 [Chloroflexi bacterium]|nr:hypothetical protein [Chloroflexota bacterium]